MGIAATPILAQFADLALLSLRLMVGLIFFTSGWRHVTNAEARSKDIEMSKGFTRFLGLLECAGALGVALGLLTQFAAMGLMLIMLGAIQEKILMADELLGPTRDRRLEL